MTNSMMRPPPGEPTTAKTSPFSSKTMVGDMELRGRLPPSTRFAIGWPLSSTSRKEKSVSWLLSRKPAAQTPEPNAPSIVVVNETALPSASTIEM